MTAKADFTPEEWDALRRAPLVAGMAVTFADPGGPIEITKETLAAQRAVAAPPGDLDLLVALSQDAMAHAKEMRHLKDDLGLKGATVREQIAAELGRVEGIVSSKATPEEAAAFREWLMQAAQASADAAKEGGFMGIGAVRVSEGEQAMLAKLREYSCGCRRPDRPRRPGRQPLTRPGRSGRTCPRTFSRVGRASSAPPGSRCSVKWRRIPSRCTRRAPWRVSSPSSVMRTSTTRRSSSGRSRRTRPAFSILSITRVRPLLLARMRLATSFIGAPWPASSRWTRTSYQRKGRSTAASSSASRMSGRASAHSKKTRQAASASGDGA